MGKVSFLSREQEFKKCFMQLESKFGLPPDIVKVLYNSFRKAEKEEIDGDRMFYRNMINFQCLDTDGNMKYTRASCMRPNRTCCHRPTCLEQMVKKGDIVSKQWELVNNPPGIRWLKGVWVKNVDTPNNLIYLHSHMISWICKYDNYILKQGVDMTKDDLYDYLIPDGKDCEWSIKHSGLKRRMELRIGEDFQRFTDSRAKLMIELNIIGENNYLRTKHYYPGETEPDIVYWGDCPLRRKIKYLNTSPWNEIEVDYETFLDWKGTEHERSWRLSIDMWGDSSFL